MKSKKNLIILIISALALIGVSIGITAFILKPPAWYTAIFAQAKTADATAKAVKNLSKKPLFKPLDKFVISIDGANPQDSRHYLMLELSLVTHDTTQIDSFNDYMPIIRNTLVQYFSQRNDQQLSEELRHINTLENALKEQLLNTLQNYGVHPNLDEVLITKYVVQ